MRSARKPKRVKSATTSVAAERDALRKQVQALEYDLRGAEFSLTRGQAEWRKAREHLIANANQWRARYEETQAEVRRLREVEQRRLWPRLKRFFF